MVIVGVQMEDAHAGIIERRSWLDTTSYERATEFFKTSVMIMCGRIEHACFHDHKERDDFDSFSSLTKYGLQAFASFSPYKLGIVITNQ